MSESHDLELALQTSGIGAEDGDQGTDYALNVMGPSPETAAATSLENNPALLSSEVSSGFISSEPNQGSTLPLVVPPQNNGVAENSGQDDTDNTVVVEDSGKEDTFVDCPDELVGSADSREATPAAEIEGSLMEERPSHMEESDLQEMQHASENVPLMHEVESLKATLKKTISEKENVMHEFKEGREALVKEILSFHRQLKNVINQQPPVNVNGSELAERLHLKETEHAEDNSLVSNTTLKDLVNECSQLVYWTLDKQLRYEATLEELRRNLLVKDQEIENLNAKVVEFSVSDEVVRSHVNTMENSVKVSSEKERGVEVVLDRVSASLNSVLNQQDVSDDSISGKTIHVERGTSLLIDNYNKIRWEINQFQEGLSLTESEIVFPETGTILSAARNELIELKAKEVTNVEKIYHLEDENRRLADQLDNYRITVETVNTELEKTKRELEQERIRCANTKEKLSMAVTKGKTLVQQREALKQSLAEKNSLLEKYSIELQEKSNGLEELVQQSDALKQSLAEKISELEKCSIELQEKSNALEAAELSKVDLVKSENLVATLQEKLLQRNTVLENYEDILSQIYFPHELQSMNSTERLKRLVDEKKVLEAISLEFTKLKSTLNLTDLPDIISSSGLKSSFSWLKESFFQVKDEIMVLQAELARTKEAAHEEINRINALLLTELQEKDYLQDELDDLTCKYQEVMVKEHQASMEKDQIVKLLQEKSGIATEDEGVSETSLDFNLLVYRCFQKIEEQTCASVDISGHVESFEKVQSLLYISHQDLMLCEIILEEEFARISDCSTRLRAMSQELREVKDEKSSLQKDLERLEEKYAVLREKLSLAVKKGKGLVQDRENMKSLLDEKNLEIEKLRVDLQSLESTVTDCRYQINLLSADTERIPELESDLGTIKDKCNLYEQFLMQSNNMLQKVIESIDGIVLPSDIVFEEPTAKVKWLAEYITECHDAKLHTEQELEKLKEEASTLASKLRDALAAMKSLEDALSSAEGKNFQLSEEKREIESSKIHSEQELQKALDEAYSQSSKFAEASLSRTLLEESLSVAENKISLLVKEKEEAQVSKITAEEESKNIKEELAVQTDKLAEAHRTTKSLEKTLTELEASVATLTEQNTEAQAVIMKLDTKQKKLQEEADSQASKLVDAVAMIKSLEDALCKAENKISIVEGERKNSENEILALNFKLNACMEELAGTNGSLQSRSAELTVHLSDLRKFITDDTLLTMVTSCFEKKFNSLKQMDIILKNTRDYFVSSGLIDSHDHHFAEDSFMTGPFSDGNVTFSVQRDNSEVIAADQIDNIYSSFRKAIEECRSKNKILTEYFERFSSSMDGLIADLLRKVEATGDEAVYVCGHIESLKETVKNLEMYKQEQENTKAMLEEQVLSLLSACVDTTKELQFEVTNDLLLLSSIPELENLKDTLPLENLTDTTPLGSSETRGGSDADCSKSAEAVVQLLSASRKVRSLVYQFGSTSKIAAATIQDLQKRLEITEATCEKVREERDLNQTVIIKLETDLQELHSSCVELRIELKACQANEEKLKDRDAEISSLCNNLLMKEQEADDNLLSASQMKTLFEKIKRTEIQLPESEIGLELYDSPDVKKLFYLIDYVHELQNQLNLQSHDKQKLQSTVTSQILAIEHLKEEVDRESREKLDSEEMKKDLSELSYSLEQILSLSGSNNHNVVLKSDGLKGLVRILEKRVLNMLSESENSKSKIEELNMKLLGSQKVVDELTTKIKLLEESLQGQTSQPDMTKERSIFEAPSFPSGSEISEIEDVGPVGKSALPSVPSALAAHARTLRKGSTDHLAINIETESDRLIGDAIQIDEDKGHVFKSLNTSGLIPRQGKLVADRIDGIWVSGGRILMNRPRARLGLIAYWLFLHIWLLGTVL